MESILKAACDAMTGTTLLPLRGTTLTEIRLTSLPKGRQPSTFPKTMQVRIVEVQWPGYRPVRLVTSLLDPQAFPVGVLLDLYHHRWHIETFFRELSSDLDFQHWHTRTLHGLWVEAKKQQRHAA